MDQQVAEVDNLAQPGNSFGDHRFDLLQAVQRLTDDLKPALDHGLRLRVADPGLAIQSLVKCTISAAARSTSISRTRGSGRIDEFAGFVDSCAQIRVPDDIRFDQIDGTAQGLAQRICEVEVLPERCQAVFESKFYQEVSIAGLWIGIRRWWHHLGKERYPEARKLLITADCGGSNGSRVRLWKVELQKLARELGIEISVCHLPPGTSKWNRIEHRLFSFISQNWRGKPLYSLTTIISLIGSTRTGAGLKVYCDRDTNEYPTGIKISKAEIEALDIRRADFHGDWNYTLLPIPDTVAVIS